jgi:hypothetical protein
VSLGEGGASVNGGRVFMWEVFGGTGNHNQMVVYEPMSGLLYYSHHPERVLSAENTHNCSKLHMWERAGPTGNDYQKVCFAFNWLWDDMCMLIGSPVLE